MKKIILRERPRSLKEYDPFPVSQLEFYIIIDT